VSTKQKKYGTVDGFFCEVVDEKIVEPLTNEEIDKTLPDEFVSRLSRWSLTVAIPAHTASHFWRKIVNGELAAVEYKARRGRAYVVAMHPKTSDTLTIELRGTGLLL
jgi:hypothetical protein